MEAQKTAEFELIKLEVHRHGQPGYFSLTDLPQQPSVAKSCLSTGWWELDQIFRPYPGQFVVVTGTAGHGKSTFLLNLICNMAQIHGTRSFLYVPENEQHIKEKLQGIWGARDQKIFADFFCSHQCFIQSSVPNRYDQDAKTLGWILDKAVIAVERDQVDFLVIDPWNELERAKPKDQLLTDYIGECLMMLKQFCRVFGVTIFMVAHPTKAGIAEGKAPGLADVEGSMNWYNKCDNGLIVVREQTSNVCRIISAKARESGSGKRGQCYFFVDEKTGIFTPQPGAVT